ncbi:hypothetical protein H181DRAFT_00448 [Streptomyces sp. WMMB 714]|uniref:hypothetical protein n=1 Tax=Streptomyces sp. WMMB 714 TaxID=1286822 RepID=UPI0005F8596A|nr:hypothetical protein [Streptomyces sp. WMMB 714]SCK09259.1 hypothetical protein H181DRAFT_00448 [Streptomyces sp. WMMB 714]
MNAEFTAVVLLAAPGTVCLAGHLWSRRQDTAIAAAFRTAPPNPPTGDGEPLPTPEALADVIAFPARRCGEPEQEQSA